MGLLFRKAIGCASLFVLSIGLAVGCRPINLPLPQGGDNTDPSERVGAPPKNEDPEVLEYCKKKGWTLIRDSRTWDKKPLIYLTVKNPDKEFEEITISP